MQAQDTDIAQKGFDAWAKGEKSGNYNDFKALLSKDFSVFSHPLMGNFKGKAAHEKISGLIAEREAVKNNLDFSNIVKVQKDGFTVFLFDSKGTVSGSYPYQGFNAIVIITGKNKITGFREYFGFVDPAWFKN